MEISLKDLDAGMGLQVVPRDPASSIGTHNIYAVEGADLTKHPGFLQLSPSVKSLVSQPWIIFQDGNPAVSGVNGCSMESLLLACADRLQAFQTNTITACPEHQAALDLVKQAVYALNQRAVRLTHEQEMKS